MKAELWMTTALAIVLAIVLAVEVLILYYVSKPRKIPCPQCGATGIAHIDGVKKKAIIPQRCPYCGGTKQVWR